MEIYTVTIPFRLPSCNTYINECRKNRYGAAKFKADLEEEIGIFLNKIPHLEKPVVIHFTWVEDNKRRDLDGICFGKKFILDAMVKKGILDNDNRKHVAGFTDSFEYGKEAKVFLEITEVGNENKKADETVGGGA